MHSGPWEKMLAFIDNTLTIYPEVKGFQVMNDAGTYMFNTYAGKWIEDTPGLRATVISTLRNWRAYSDSSPVRGVTQAINTYGRDGKKISIYVLGDDFAQGSMANVLKVIDNINEEDENGDRLVRIHGIGFSSDYLFADEGARRFSMLMREMASRNGGTFVGLNR
jgi:hypothetical protein